MIDIARRTRQLREQAALQLDELARRVGMGASDLSRLRMGQGK